jgi:tetratricopeptide (TPR) repeat protein
VSAKSVNFLKVNQSGAFARAAVRLAGLLLAPLLSAAASQWISLRSGSITVLTDAGERQGRQCLARLEELRDSLGQQWGQPLAVRVLLFRRDGDFAELRGEGPAGGFFQSGPERDYIALPASSAGWQRILSHEYVHLLLHHSTGPLPKWLEEGLAEFYSTAGVSRGKLRIGVPVAEHLAALRRRRLLEAGEFLEASREFAHGRGEPAALFYPQSWALVHMLMLEPEYRGRMDELLGLLNEAVPELAAFQKAFGKTLDEAMRGLDAYLGRAVLPMLETAAAAPERGQAQPMAANHEAEIAQVELALLRGRTEVAQRKLERLEREHGDSPEVRTALALFALGANDRERALQQLRRAIELGSTDALPYFEYAIALRDQGAPDELVKRHLLEALERNPNHAEAHFIVGLMLSRAGDDEAAAGHYREAARLLPRQSSFWHALALCHHRLGQQEEAMKAAQRALNAATTPEQIDMAQGALRLTGTHAPPAPSSKPSVRTGAGWERPRPDAGIEGRLESIECQGKQAVLTLRAGGGTVRLLVRDPGEVTLRNADAAAFEFRCGAQSGPRVRVEYLSRTEERWKTQGEVLALELLN